MQIVLRAAIIFLILYLITRVTGKRQLSQMNAFELVLLVVMISRRVLGLHPAVVWLTSIPLHTGCAQSRYQRFRPWGEMWRSTSSSLAAA